MSKTLPDGTTVSTLPNGLRIIVSPKKGTKAAAIALVVGVGSKEETPETNGRAHFLEHMLFEGSAHYPSSSDVNRAIASIGGDFNATTNVESTVFTFLVPREGVREALAILGDVVCRPLLSEDQVRRERDVVSEEVGEKADDPHDTLENLFAELLFPEHGLGLSITGTVSDLKRYTAKDLRTLYTHAYRPDNMVLSVVTDMPAEGILDAVQNAFLGFKGHARKNRVKKVSKVHDRIAVRTLKGTQAYLVLGGRGPSWGTPDRAPLEIAMAALGGSMYARLPLLLRETLGEVYAIESTVESFTEAGLFATFTDCRPKNVEDVMRRIAEAYIHVGTHPLTQEEIDLARSVLLGESIVGLDDPGAQAEFYGSHLLLHNIFLSPDDIHKEWRRVGPKDVERVVKTWITPEALSLACLTPSRKGLGAVLPKA